MRSISTKLVITLLLGIFSLGATSFADHHKGKGKHKQKAKAHKHEMSEQMEAKKHHQQYQYDDDREQVFSVQERQVLSAYQTKSKVKKKKLPKGLKKKMARGGELPPGWQKKLARGEVLDQQIYQQARPIPNSVMVQLPPQPAGTILVEIDGEIVRLAQATMTIIDILGG